MTKRKKIKFAKQIYVCWWNFSCKKDYPNGIKNDFHALERRIHLIILISSEFGNFSGAMHTRCWDGSMSKIRSNEWTDKYKTNKSWQRNGTIYIFADANRRHQVQISMTKTRKEKHHEFNYMINTTLFVEILFLEGSYGLRWSFSKCQLWLSFNFSTPKKQICTFD